jgi:predicted nucleic acid-binding protein
MTTTAYYFDASALVKYYILEPGSTWVRAIINATETQGSHLTNTIFVSDISVTEVAAAFAILHRTQRIRRSARDGAFGQLVNDATGRYQLIGADHHDFFAAASLTQSHPLKAYDAVQLAVALRHAANLAPYNLPLMFICGDRTLLAAAQAVQLLVDNPFDHVAPQDTPAEP